jgi:hypothetical protein
MVTKSILRLIVLIFFANIVIYLDMNGLSIQTLESPPTAAEFAQLVHISRPVIIKGPLVLIHSLDQLVI